MSLNGKTTTNTSAFISNVLPWPDLRVQIFIDQFRLPGEFGEDVIIGQLTNAVLLVNNTLGPVKDVILPELLVDIEQDKINDTGIWVHHYYQAVFNHARGGLTHLFETVNRTEPAEIQGDRATELSAYWQQESHGHIQKLIDHFNPSQSNSDGFHASLI